VIVTDLALLRRTAEGFRIDEVARGFTAAEVSALTGMAVSVADDVAVMQDAWGDPG
jgi:acyl CoA:acetate/3-ketoacid CoA transferase beta subunit